MRRVSLILGSLFFVGILLASATPASAGWGAVGYARLSGGYGGYGGYGGCGNGWGAAYYRNVGPRVAYTAYNRGRGYAARYAYYPNRGYRPYRGSRVQVYYPGRTYYSARRAYSGSPSGTRFVRAYGRSYRIVSPRIRTVRSYRYRGYR